jgi:hypothetical protein
LRSRKPEAGSRKPEFFQFENPKEILPKNDRDRFYSGFRLLASYNQFIVAEADLK